MARLWAVLCGVCGVLAAVLAAPVSDCPRDTEPDQPVFLASDQNCSQFYLCSNGRPIPLTCPDGLYFNTDTDQCDYSYNVNCTEPVPTTTSTTEPSTTEPATTEPSTTITMETTTTKLPISTTKSPISTTRSPISTTRSPNPTTELTTTRSPVSTIQQ